MVQSGEVAVMDFRSMAVVNVWVVVNVLQPCMVVSMAVVHPRPPSWNIYMTVPTPVLLVLVRVQFIMVLRREPISAAHMLFACPLCCNPSIFVKSHSHSFPDSESHFPHQKNDMLHEQGGYLLTTTVPLRLLLMR